MEQHNTDILVIGAGLTGLTTAFRLTRGGKQVHILECSNRVGGQIHTFREDGFVFESGPNTGVISYPEVAELFEALSPACQLETAHEEAKRRLIWKGNSFCALPSGLFSAITTPLFTLGDKFRILGEPFRAKGTNPDESVGELAARRLGKSFLNYAVDPFLSGVYAGDPLKLITRYALPKLYNLEQQYGGFIKARLPKTERDRLATKKVFSAAGGLENLAKAMAEAIGSRNITLSASGVTVRPSEKGWLATYTTSEGEQLMPCLTCCRSFPGKIWIRSVICNMLRWYRRVSAFVIPGVCVLTLLADWSLPAKRRMCWGFFSRLPVSIIAHRKKERSFLSLSVASSGRN